MNTVLVSLCKGSPYHRSRPDTLIVEVARCVDCLSCQAWKYYGERLTTFAKLHATRTDILAAVNAEFGTNFRRCVVRRAG
mgnify:CR=1 FL=1